jgi:hypothetical protein
MDPIAGQGAGTLPAADGQLDDGDRLLVGGASQREPNVVQVLERYMNLGGLSATPQACQSASKVGRSRLAMSR